MDRFGNLFLRLLLSLESPGAGAPLNPFNGLLSAFTATRGPWPPPPSTAAPPVLSCSLGLLYGPARVYDNLIIWCCSTFVNAHFMLYNICIVHREKRVDGIIMCKGLVYKDFTMKFTQPNNWLVKTYCTYIKLFHTANQL